MQQAIAAFNAGSSSVKFALYAVASDVLRPILRGQMERLPGAPRIKGRIDGGAAFEASVPAAVSTPAEAARYLLAWVERHLAGLRLVGVGHRVVHGGTRFSGPVAVDPDVLQALRMLVPLAPLHQPQNLAAIEVVGIARPDVAQVACFDTAFHRSQPESAQLYALPPQLAEAGIRRYGFHGLSYESVARALPEMLGPRAEGRVVVAHLGNGASLCAMRNRRSVATSMGFTALDGLVMGTRAGNLDPGVLLYLMRERGYDEAQLSRLLYFESGLLGVSGLSHDMRDLLASKGRRAKLAVELFTHRACREIASHAAALEGLEALVFTGGIGERCPAVRAAICHRLRWLGVELDSAANEANRSEIHTSSSAVSVLVIPADEEAVIAQHTASTLALT